MNQEKSPHLTMLVHWFWTFSLQTERNKSPCLSFSVGGTLLCSLSWLLHRGKRKREREREMFVEHIYPFSHIILSCLYNHPIKYILLSPFYREITIIPRGAENFPPLFNESRQNRDSEGSLSHSADRAFASKMRVSNFSCKSARKWTFRTRQVTQPVE